MSTTTMTHLFVEPADVLLFRDGRPFSAGEDHRATGTFPPSPSVVYGALRSALLAQAGADFTRDDFGLRNGVERSLGTRARPGTLALRSLTLARRTRPGGPVERLWPAPAFLLGPKDPERGARTLRLAPRDALPAGMTNLPDGLRPLLPAEPHPAHTFYERVTGYLAESAFEDVLAGGVPSTNGAFVEPAALFVREPRTHVALRGRDDDAFRGTAQEGMLFVVDFVRLRPGVGFALGVEHLPDGERVPPLLRLGGEGRAALLEEVRLETASGRVREAVAAAGGRLVLVLTTPCPSAHGWRPEALTAEGVRLPDGRTLGARLVGAATGRHVVVGGWDVARKRPKPARRAAPPGSAYFLDDVADPLALFDALDGQSLCLHETDRRQGFGLVRVGVWT